MAEEKTPASPSAPPADDSVAETQPEKDAADQAVPEGWCTLFPFGLK